MATRSYCAKTAETLHAERGDALLVRASEIAPLSGHLLRPFSREHAAAVRHYLQAGRCGQRHEHIDQSDMLAAGNVRSEDGLK